MAELLKSVNGLLKMLYYMDEEKDLQIPKKILLPARQQTTYELCGDVVKRLSKEGAVIAVNIYSYTVSTFPHIVILMSLYFLYSNFCKDEKGGQPTPTTANKEVSVRIQCCSCHHTMHLIVNVHSPIIKRR